MSPASGAALYLGLGVAVAVALRRREPSPMWTVPLHALVWPFVAPSLFVGAPVPAPSGVESDVLAALGDLDGVAADVLAPELARLRAALASLGAARRRVGEMEALLDSPAFDRVRAEASLADLATRGLRADDSRRDSVRGRLATIDRLSGLLERTRVEVERADLKLEELGTRIRLLRFVERPGSDAADLIRDFAASVDAVGEALSEGD